MINLAHGEIFMLGAVGSTFILVEIFDAQSLSAINLSLLIFTFILAAIFGAGLSWLTNISVYQKLRKSKPTVPLIASLGVTLILQNVAILWNGSGAKKFQSIIPPALPFRAFFPTVERTAVVLLFTMPAIILVIWVINRSKHGLAIRAIADDSSTSVLVGVNVNKSVSWTFIVAGACAGSAGVIYAQQFQISNYTLGMQVGLLAYAAAIIGGVDSIKGTILGGLTIGIVEALSDGVTSGLGYRWSQTAIYGVFILMLVYKPEGIWGTKQQISSV
jgi:branched-chain amino acid transport system permease protein